MPKASKPGRHTKTDSRGATNGPGRRSSKAPPANPPPNLPAGNPPANMIIDPAVNPPALPLPDFGKISQALLVLAGAARAIDLPQANPEAAQVHQRLQQIDDRITLLDDLVGTLRNEFIEFRDVLAPMRAYNVSSPRVEGPFHQRLPQVETWAGLIDATGDTLDNLNYWLSLAVYNPDLPIDAVGGNGLKDYPIGDHVETRRAFIQRWLGLHRAVRDPQPAGTYEPEDEA